MSFCLGGIAAGRLFPPRDLVLCSVVCFLGASMCRPPVSRQDIGDLASVDESSMILSRRDETTIHHRVMAHELEPWSTSCLFAFVASPQFLRFRRVLARPPLLQ